MEKINTNIVQDIYNLQTKYGTASILEIIALFGKIRPTEFLLLGMTVKSLKEAIRLVDFR